MSGVLVIGCGVFGTYDPQRPVANYEITACDQWPRPSEAMFIDNSDHLPGLRTKAAVLAQILNVEVIDTTK